MTYASDWGDEKTKNKMREALTKEDTTDFKQIYAHVIEAYVADDEERIVM